MDCAVPICLVICSLHWWHGCLLLVIAVLADVIPWQWLHQGSFASAAVRVVLLSFAAGRRKSHWSGCVKVATVMFLIFKFEVIFV
jgi:hypothetical protein